MSAKTQFDIMRETLAPRGTAPIVNLAAHLPSGFFDHDLVKGAIDEAEKRVAAFGQMPGIAAQLSPLERFGLAILMRASGQDPA